MGELAIDKEKDPLYNENDYIDNILAKNEITKITGEIVLVDGWNFLIDRTVPKVVDSLGKGDINSQIQIKANQTLNADYTQATIQIEIIYGKEIQSIQFQGKEIEIPEKVGGKYIVTVPVKANGTYSIVAKDEEGKIQVGSISVVDLVEDEDIYTAEDLRKFRDNVNKGANYEGKNIRVMADIDLKGSEENQWLPIGISTLPFKGNFDGNNHTISNIYINTKEDYQGLFRKAENSNIKNIKISNVNCIANVGAAGLISTAGDTTIENIIVENGIIKGNKSAIGGIVGINTVESKNLTIRNCINKAQVTGGNRAGGIMGGAQLDSAINIENCVNKGEVLGEYRIGGIVGDLRVGNIEKCVNEGNVKATVTEIGGIVGAVVGDKNSAIKSSYNTGNIEGLYSVGGIAGILHDKSITSKIQYCYNTGAITAKDKTSSNNSWVGGIIGSGNRGDTYIDYCYNTGTINYVGEARGGITGGVDYANCYLKNVFSTTLSYKSYRSYQKVEFSGTNADLSNEELKAWTQEEINQYLTQEFVKPKNSNINQGFPVLKWQSQ